MITINAKDFLVRSDLENHIRNLVGLTPDTKLDYEIVGTRAELQKLQLSDRTIFWGIRCVITDDPTQKVEAEKPQRGEIQEFGIVGKGKLRKPKK